MLIDRYLPVFDLSERHEVVVAAPPDRTYAAARRMDLARSRAVRGLFVLRMLPALWRRDRERGPRTATVDDLTREGFIPLDEETGTEFVLGLVGRLWRPGAGLVRMEPDDFESFARPGYARVAWNVRVEPLGDDAARSVLFTEVRVACTDEKARGKFLLYWTLMGPATGMVLRRSLGLAKADAERAHGQLSEGSG